VQENTLFKEYVDNMLWVNGLPSWVQSPAPQKQNKTKKE
jgi:hypothetical protein